MMVEPTPYYEDEDGIIYQGDCKEILSRIKRGPIKLIMTSPPYNIGKKYADWEDHLSDDEYVSFISETLSLCLQSSKYTFWNMQWLDKTRKAILDVCLNEFKTNLKDLFVWHKKPMNAPKKGLLSPGFEFVFLFGPDNERMFSDNNFPSNRYVPNIQSWYNTKTKTKKHPATFPSNLPEYFIRYFTHPQDTVMDPFLGSGTTTSVAKRLGRKYIGIEITKEYCDRAIERIERTEKERNLDGFFNFEPSNESIIPKKTQLAPNSLRKDKHAATYIDILLLDGEYTITEVIQKVKSKFPDNKHLTRKGLEQHIQYLRKERGWKVYIDQDTNIVKAEYVPRWNKSAAGLVDFLLLEGRYTYGEILEKVCAQYPSNKQFKKQGDILQHIHWKKKQHGWHVKEIDGKLKIQT